MKFIDEAVVEITAAAGGNGCVSFHREKYVPRGGPDGGDGGKGGSVLFVGNPNMTTLLDYRYKKHLASGRGGNGSGNNRHGKNGSDLIIPVPVGTEVIDNDTGTVIADITTADKPTQIMGPARGGRGNARFAGPTNQAPREAENGAPARTMHIRLSLKVMAEVGIIGYPNVGKSTLITRISHARPKIADYPFTTLTPNLGVVRFSDDMSFVVADIPGIIEGAHTGTGLGIRFLKHVERTRLLIHIVDCDPGNGRNPHDDYLTLNRELLSYSGPLAEKPQIVVGGKIDIEGAHEKLGILKEPLQRLGIDIFPISAMNGEGVAGLLKEIARRISILRFSETPRPDPSTE
jgi:GTP-binding protein